MFGLMCPKTGYATHPTCCNVDGKTVNVQGCKCGDTSCSSDQLCTASTSTCAYPVCSNTDGSKIIGDMKGGKCQCGKYECVAGQKCDAATDTSSACEYPVCSTVDGSAVATNAKCKCGTYAICDEGDTCTGKQRMIDVFGTIMLTFFSFFFSSFSQKADTNTCKSKSTTPTQAPTQAPSKELPKCKVDVVTTEKCMCQKGGSASSANQASIGQTCPKDSNDPIWPACSGSDVYKILNGKCKCADRTLCGYGSKCTQSGTYKGRCECVRGNNVGCLEVVQPKGTCPLSCDDHTTMNARPIVFDECLEVASNWDVDYHVKYSVGNGHANPVYYSDNNCKTEAVMPEAKSPIPGGCQDDFKVYLTLPGSPGAANGGTALQITVPALFVVGLLAFVLL